MKKFVAIWMLIVALLCSQVAFAAPTQDRAGNPIVVPEKVETILSLAPSITEVVLALGEGEKLVGIDKYSKDIEGVPADLPVFDLMKPDVEQIVALKPDLVLATNMSLTDGVDNFKPLTDLGICIVYVPSSDSLQGIVEDNLYLGELLNKKAEAEALNGAMQETIDRIAAIGKTIENKKRVYFEISAAPYLYSFGTGTFLNEMVDLIGAENILADQAGWISVSEEAVLAANPDVILTNVNYIEAPIEEICARPGWDVVTAVKEKAVYSIDTNASSRSNHLAVKALEEMAKAVYPELYQ